MTDIITGSVTVETCNRILLDGIMRLKSCTEDGSMPDPGYLRLIAVRLEKQAEAIETGIAI